MKGSRWDRGGGGGGLVYSKGRKETRRAQAGGQGSVTALGGAYLYKRPNYAEEFTFMSIGTGKEEKAGRKTLPAHSNTKGGKRNRRRRFSRGSPVTQCSEI